MHKHNHQLIYSPTDLTTFLASPFASWMDRLLTEKPKLDIQIDEVDLLLSSLQSKGLNHEAALLAQFEAQGKMLVTIPNNIPFEKQYFQTKQAILEGAEVIYQAALSLSPFQGYADFLVKTPTASKLGQYSY